MATLRTEIFRGDDPMGEAIAGATIAVNSSPSEAWEPPAVMDEGRAFNPGKSATFEAFGGPVYVAIGEVPDPTAEPRRLVRPGLKVTARMHAGQRVSAAVATDIPA